MTCPREMARDGCRLAKISKLYRSDRRSSSLGRAAGEEVRSAMVLSSRTWCEDGLRRALDELVALRAMYGADEGDDISADINDVAVEIAEDALRNDADAAPTSLSHVPALDATVRFGGGGATVRVSLPPGYPARSRPMIVAECASRHRGSDASWRMQLAADDAVEASGWGDDARADGERVGNPGRSDPDPSASPSSSDDDDDEVEDGQQCGEECALSAVEAARQAFLDYLASIAPEQEGDDAPKIKHPNARQSPAKRGRRLVWFHHVKSGKKRRKMREWSAELSVDGVVKCGYPGVCVVEGETRACDEFVRRLRSLGWSAMSVRAAEDDDEEEFDEEFADDKGAVSKRGLRRGWSEIGEDGGMSALAEVLRHANLERLMSAALRQNV